MLNKQILNIITISLLFAGCKKDVPLYEINNLNNNQVQILGHAGMGLGYKYPGNSYESIRAVLQIGADGSEIDVQLTSDSVLVLFHDDLMEQKTTCSGLVNEHKWSEIGGCIYHAIERNVYVITLDNLFSRIPNLSDYYFSIDCKLYKRTNINREVFYSQYARALKRIIEKYSMHNNIYIEVPNNDFLTVLKENNVPGKYFIAGYGDIKQSIEIATQNNLFGVAFGRINHNREEVDSIHANGLWAMMWEVYSESANLDALQKSPDVIQTDKPIPMLKMLNRYNKLIY